MSNSTNSTQLQSTSLFAGYTLRYLTVAATQEKLYIAKDVIEAANYAHSAIIYRVCNPAGISKFKVLDDGKRKVMLVVTEENVKILLSQNKKKWTNRKPSSHNVEDTELVTYVAVAVPIQEVEELVEVETFEDAQEPDYSPVVHSQEYLELIDINGVQHIDSRLMATELGIEHRALLQTIRSYQNDIENAFGLVAFEMSPASHESGTKYQTVAHLNKEQAEFIATLSRNSPKVVAFKIKLVKSFNRLQAQAQLPAQPPFNAGVLGLMEMSLQALKEQDNRITIQEQRTDKQEQITYKLLAELHDVKQQLKERNEDELFYFTILGYFKLKNQPIPTDLDSKNLGRLATIKSREMNIQKLDVPSAKFGKIGTYHITVLEAVLGF